MVIFNVSLPILILWFVEVTMIISLVFLKNYDRLSIFYLVIFFIKDRWMFQSHSSNSMPRSV